MFAIPFGLLFFKLCVLLDNATGKGSIINYSHFCSGSGHLQGNVHLNDDHCDLIIGYGGNLEWKNAVAILYLRDEETKIITCKSKNWLVNSLGFCTSFNDF